MSRPYRPLEAGIEVALELADATDVFGTGELGIGNTSPSSAIVSTLCNISVADAVGRGTGLDDEQMKHKIQVIEKGIKLNNPDPNDPIDVLAKVGGFEIAGIAGLILGAALKKKPVIVDGFISTAGALIAEKSVRPPVSTCSVLIAALKKGRPQHFRRLARTLARPQFPPWRGNGGCGCHEPCRGCRCHTDRNGNF